MGDEFPDAEVEATDLSPIQPSSVPVNVHFFIDDATEDDWAVPPARKNNGTVFIFQSSRSVKVPSSNRIAIRLRLYPYSNTSWMLPRLPGHHKERLLLHQAGWVHGEPGRTVHSALRRRHDAG